jgi:hypothetical protein
MRRRSLFGAALIAGATASGGAMADTVVLGSDYLSTQPGTFIYLGPSIGNVDFEGNPNYTSYPIPSYPSTNPPTITDTNLRGTDTILQRTADITIGDTNPGTNLLVKAISLESTAPVFVPGFGSTTVYASLDPNNLANDTGTLAIFGSAAAGGTFNSTFTVFIDICTGAGVNGVGCGTGALLTTAEITLGQTGASWQPTPAGAFHITGPVGDQWADIHTGLAAGQSDFFFSPGAPVKECNGPNGCHYVTSNIPEPSTWAMMLLGFGGVGFAYYRERRAKALAAAA